MTGFLSVVVMTAVVGLAWSGCIPGWTEYEGSCYRYIVQWPETWTRAEEYCQETAPDGHLVSIGSEDENTWVFNWWISMLPAFSPVDDSSDLVIISPSGDEDQEVEEPINGLQRRAVKSLSRRKRWARPPHRHPNCRHQRRDREPKINASDILDDLVTIAPVRDGEYVWIGFEDRYNNGSWRWSDGITKNNITFWHPENPPEDHDCAMMVATSSEGPGLWEVSACPRRRSFLCEYLAPNVTGGMC